MSGGFPVAATPIAKRHIGGPLLAVLGQGLLELALAAMHEQAAGPGLAVSGGDVVVGLLGVRRARIRRARFERVRKQLGILADRLIAQPLLGIDGIVPGLLCVGPRPLVDADSGGDRLAGDRIGGWQRDRLQPLIGDQCDRHQASPRSPRHCWRSSSFIPGGSCLTGRVPVGPHEAPRRRPPGWSEAWRTPTIQMSLRRV
jgi:hypothetical protein